MQLTKGLAQSADATPAPWTIRRGRPIYRTLPGETVREFHAFVPTNADARSKIVVLVHGISTNAAEHVVRFAQEAERHGAILVAPLFEKAVYGKYQQVVDPKRGMR